MQMSLGSKIPNLQVLLQFYSLNTNNLVNQVGPGEADRSLVSSDMKGKTWELQALRALVTTWET